MLPGLSIILLVLLLLFPAYSLKGAADGLLLWFHVVLPTLAPFMICTQLVANTHGLELFMKPFAPLFHLIFGLSRDGSYILLCGLLCGYPLGARLCAEFLKDGRISKKEANYLFSICNHPSPMFLSGYLQAVWKHTIPTGLLFLCLYGPVLPISLLSRHYYMRGAENSAGFAAVKPVQHASPEKNLEEILLSTSETMILIGNYIMLFSILSEWIVHIPSIPPRLQAILSGIAEITTGSNRICRVFPEKQAFIPLLCTVAFGGLSGIFQTRAVTKNAGLDIRHYVFWKLILSGSMFTLGLLLPHTGLF